MNLEDILSPLTLVSTDIIKWQRKFLFESNVEFTLAQDAVMCGCVYVYVRVCKPLTDDVHLAEVQADFGEGGDASNRVVSPTIAVLSSGAVGWTLGGVIEPGKHTHTHTWYLSSTLHFHGIPSFTDRIRCWESVGFCNETGFSHCYPAPCLPEAKDLWKILSFSRRQGDVLLWSLCLHSCTVDLRREGWRRMRRW